MTSPSRDPAASAIAPPHLSTEEVDELLSKTLIAKLATLDPSGSIHLVPMWYERVGSHIHIPTSHFTRKYHNLVRHPFASVMVDISRSGLDLRGVLIRGAVDLVEGDEAKALNRSIHQRYVTAEGLQQLDVAAYLAEGDDATIRVSMDRIVTWNNAGSSAGRALMASGNVRPLDGREEPRRDGDRSR
ncbi:MAG: pyridoxamine 5'-phosphate oxidase family protein [Actinobacteria bacterium]|nr:pyridoxamine 5'-phosphate oxidase family protein [Actinomycetota bacterium]